MQKYCSEKEMNNNYFKRINLLAKHTAINKHGGFDYKRESRTKLGDLRIFNQTSICRDCREIPRRGWCCKVELTGNFCSENGCIRKEMEGTGEIKNGKHCIRKIE